VTWKGEANDEGDADDAWNGEADEAVVVISDPPARSVGVLPARARNGWVGRCSCCVRFAWLFAFFSPTEACASLIIGSLRAPR
jgi:hypothetical protein